MRGRSIFLSLTAIAILIGSAATAMSRATATAHNTYLALGDSLAASFQPNGDHRSGYAEQVFQLEQANVNDLRLTKLGCPGERTNTIDRVRKACPQPAGSQLDQAVRVLERGNVAFVTLHIGSNDLFPCFRFGRGMFAQRCVDERLPKIGARLTSIVETLQAADPGVTIVGGNYHDPLLALATIPGFPQDAVKANADVWTSFNDTLEQTYVSLGVPVADIETEFSSTDFDTIVHLPRDGDAPINVTRVCEWTYACSARFEHDFHPNTIGYAAMTRAWEAALAS
jgi:lysophospholipase L1-like esterase